MTRLTPIASSALAAGIFLAIDVAPLLAAAPDAAPRPVPAETEGVSVQGSDWDLEQVTLTDGRTFRGLVQSENKARIDFIEVHRRPGQPMFLVVRPIERSQIDQLQRLSPEQQANLGERLEQHRHRARIEAARMEDLTLSPRRSDDRLSWRYEGDWFALESTADESVTRRSIVRLEQLFAAYRQVLSPRWNSPARLRVRIFGTSEEYHQALTDLGLAIRNPAVYLPERNLILAGSNMNRFAVALDRVEREHERIRDELDRMVAEAPSRIAELRATLRRNQIPAAQRQKILTIEQRKWETKRRDARSQIAALERKNAAKFDVVAGKMFRRLAHEALHAYLETFVFPRTSYDVPRWLNEGLAQTFEAGLLEADTLRIDIPNDIALSRLQSELAGGDPLSLRELLEAGSDAFLAGHAEDGQTVSRAYYYSWGLAYYLAFERGVLSNGRIEAYLDPAAVELAPVARFEELVGEPLEQFEPKWREAMLALSKTRQP